MSALIDKFDIDSYGQVKLRKNGPNGDVEHTYWNVPKSIIVKLVSASKAPTVQDFDGWLSDYRQKQHNKYKDIASPIKCGSSFWSDND